MRKHISFIYLFGLLVFQYSNAVATRGPDFIVYFTRGRIIKIDDPKALPLKKGDKLYNADNIKLSANAQIVLIDKNFHSVNIYKTGTIKLATVINDESKSRTSFTAAYLHFIWDEFNESEKEVNPNNYMNNVGAVSRGKAFKMNINPDTIDYFNGELTLSWPSKHKALTFKLLDDSKANYLLKELNVTGNFFRFDSLLNKIKKPGNYYWEIFDGNVKIGGNFYLLVMSKQAYFKKMNSLMKDVVKTTPAETAYMKAFILEDNNLPFEAAKYYKIAATIEPENKFYQSSKSRFHE